MGEERLNWLALMNIHRGIQLGIDGSPRSQEQEELASRIPFVAHFVLILL
jgi:hypothetical protein